MLRPEGDTASVGFDHQGLLTIGRDKPTSTATTLGVGPTTHANLAATRHLSHGTEAATELDDCASRFQHGGNIALIAMLVNRKCCDNRFYTLATCSATLRRMEEVIDGKWIERRLTGARGEKTRLAEALGIKRDQVSKIIAGERGIQPVELPRLLNFFGLAIVPVATSEEALELVAHAANQLNQDGLNLARQQISVLASNPTLARKPRARRPTE